MSELAIYIHIPFCKRKCVYCDFNTFARIERLMPPMADALSAELTAWGAALKRPRVGSVFWGGGTPSYLPPRHIEAIWRALAAAFELNPDAEITIEVNPDDVTPQRAAAWRALGFNRLSMGVQALDDALLRQMSRRHSVAQARKALTTVKAAGFKNYSFDLIYGWPKQTLAQWQTTLARALEFEPRHISLYSLQVEPTTPLSALIDAGDLPPPNDDLMADMYNAADETLERNGLPNYEISNWAQVGFECRHNLTYWRCGAYIGVGAGAHSSYGGVRFANIKPPTEYIKRAQALAATQTKPTLDSLLNGALIETRTKHAQTPADQIAETIILGLRLKEGVNRAQFKQRFKRELQAVYGRQIKRCVKLGLMQADAAAIRLTRRGRLLSNEVFVQFLNAPD